MREIKVRGFAVDEMVRSQWMYGTGIHITEFTDEYFEETGVREECFVWTASGWIHVHKDSIGQYTGLKDKNSREVYEGDILEIIPENREHYPEKSVFFVVSTQTLWGYDFDWEHVSGYGCSTHIARIDDNYEQLLNVEVIGNIHENPELLEGESND